MPTISKEVPYNGAVERIRRLGLGELIYEVRQIITGFELRVKEEKDANGGAAVRKLIDASFSRAQNWTKQQVGGSIGQSALKSTALVYASASKYNSRHGVICWSSTLFIFEPQSCRDRSTLAYWSWRMICLVRT